MQNHLPVIKSSCTRHKSLPTGRWAFRPSWPFRRSTHVIGEETIWCRRIESVPCSERVLLSLRIMMLFVIWLYHISNCKLILSKHVRLIVPSHSFIFAEHISFWTICLPQAAIFAFIGFEYTLCLMDIPFPQVTEHLVHWVQAPVVQSGSREWSESSSMGFSKS